MPNYAPRICGGRGVRVARGPTKEPCEEASRVTLCFRVSNMQLVVLSFLFPLSRPPPPFAHSCGHRSPDGYGARWRLRAPSNEGPETEYSLGGGQKHLQASSPVAYTHHTRYLTTPPFIGKMKTFSGCLVSRPLAQTPQVAGPKSNGQKIT